MNRRDNAGAVSGMDAGELNVLHNGGNKCVCSVADRICLAFQCMIQETVDQDRAVGCHADGCIHISLHTLIIIDDFHASSTKHVGRTNHNRITDLVSDFHSLIHGSCHACFRHRDLQLIHHRTELVTVLCQINDSR